MPLPQNQDQSKQPEADVEAVVDALMRRVRTEIVGLALSAPAGTLMSVSNGICTVRIEGQDYTARSLNDDSSTALTPGVQVQCVAGPGVPLTVLGAIKGSI